MTHAWCRLRMRCVACALCGLRALYVRAACVASDAAPTSVGRSFSVLQGLFMYGIVTKLPTIVMRRCYSRSTSNAPNACFRMRACVAAFLYTAGPSFCSVQAFVPSNKKYGMSVPVSFHNSPPNHSQESFNPESLVNALTANYLICLYIYIYIYI